LASDPLDNAFISIPPVLNPCEDARTLASKAERCRRLAAGISDKQTSDVLIGMARTYEQAAEQLQPQARG
jgi:hypothetical protein